MNGAAGVNLFPRQTHQKLIMIMGMQRSGTTALFETLATAPGLGAYNESPDDALYRNYFLRPEPEIRSVLNAEPSSILLKPVRETERRTVKAVFEEYSAYDLHILWLYRTPVNVVYSWEQIGMTTRELLETKAKEWVVRNQALLETPAEYHQRLITLRYEDLIENPTLLNSLAQRLGLRIQSKLRADSNAGRRALPPELQASIDRITGKTLEQLNQMRTFRPASEPVRPRSALLGGIKQRLGGLWGRNGETGYADALAPTVVTPWSGLASGSDLAPSDPDFLSQEFQQDPYACFRRWRERGTVQYLPWHDIWLVLGYDAVGAALQAPERFLAPLNTSPIPEVPLPTAYLDRPADGNRTLVPPEIPVPVSQMEQQVRQMLKPHVGSGAFNGMEFCQQAASSLFCDLLGVSPDAQGAFFGRVYQGEKWATLRTVVDHDGLFGKIIEHEQWSDDAINLFLSFAQLYHYHPLCAFLGNALRLLVSCPELVLEVRQQPALLSALMTELRRMAPPILTTKRRTKTDVALDGQTVPAGHFVFLAIGAANRDPDRFEHPEQMDLHRSAPTALSNGMCGTFPQWHCEQLGQIVSETILRVVLTEFPLLEIAQPPAPVAFWDYLPTLHEPKRLIVTFQEKVR